MLFADFSIRHAEKDDFAFLDGLARARGYPEADYFARCFEEQESGRRVIFIAQTAEKHGVGYVMLNRVSRYQPFRSLKVPEIQDLFVLPEYRQHGTGRALVAACEQAAREGESTMIGLAVGLHGRYGAAQRLYVRMGYLPDGFGVVYDCAPVTPGDRHPVDDDLCLMMLKDFQDSGKQNSVS